MPRSISPESSGRASPIPRQWQNHAGAGEPFPKDKAWRRYASGVEKALTLFETALEEWADYISFLNKLLKALQSGPASNTIIAHKSLVAKRLSQCLNPTLPSGVHQKTIEVYHHVFMTIGRDGLSRDLPLYLPGLSPTLSFASLSVRSPFLELLEHHFLAVDARSLRPAMKSIILALLPGLEDESSEDFDRTLRLVAKFKEAIRPQDSELLTDIHSLGDTFFWQCFFLASVTSPSRRAGALAYLTRNLPRLSSHQAKGSSKSSSERHGTNDRLNEGLSAVVTTPEPGLLVRCFASGLSDDQLLIQRGFLDLLVTHMPLDSTVLQEKVKPTDVELLLKAAVGVVTRRDMSLNRRLWAWLLGPEPSSQEQESSNDSGDPGHGSLSPRTAFFETYGLQPLTNALLDMIHRASKETANERARPYRICLSLMDRWEIGGLVVPEVFLPIIRSVQAFKDQAAGKAEFDEILRSASVFFDGIESGLIYGEMVSLLAQSISPGDMSIEERRRKLDLVSFIINHFNVREEEMIMIHAPLCCLALLSMLEDAKLRRGKFGSTWNPSLEEQAINIALCLLDLVPERALRRIESSGEHDRALSPDASNANILKGIRNFYVEEQGSIDATSPPLAASTCGELILKKATLAVQRESQEEKSSEVELGARIKVLNSILSKTSKHTGFDRDQMIESLRHHLDKRAPLPFTYYTSIVNLCTQLHGAERISDDDLSGLIPPLVYHAWCYLHPSEPKYHVEAIRCLWQLQTLLTISSRDIEAAICSIIVGQSKGASSHQLIDVGRTFGVLWAQTLQDNASDRRGAKPVVSESRIVNRLSGIDHYEIMLTQPLLLILDALQDERTQLHMAVKSWLSSVVGMDKLFLLLISQFLDVPFLRRSHAESNQGVALGASSSVFSEEDDLDLCLYYLRTLNNVFTYTGEVSWAIVASKQFSLASTSPQMTNDGEYQKSHTMQDFFVKVCMRCVICGLPASPSTELQERASQLQRSALPILHRFFLSQHSAPFADYHFEDVLLDRLASSIDDPDPYIQALLLDVVYDALRLREGVQLEYPRSPLSEKRSPSIDPSRTSRASISIDTRLVRINPPPQLLKCLQAGLSREKGRPVLDSWVAFLTHCLPFYAESVFQVLIPLVETLCREVASTFTGLRTVFQSETRDFSAIAATPDTTLIYLLNGLEQVLARAHDQLLAEESRAQLAKSPDQPQSIFGSMVSGVFQSDNPQTRSATANDRLTVHLAFQDAVRICYKIWCWGQGDETASQDATSSASFNYTSLRMRNRARRLLEHLFNAETLECLETVMDIWKGSSATSEQSHVFDFLASLDASRPKHSIPSLFNSMYSRTNPSALDPARISTMTISLQDTDIGAFLVEYARSLDDDAMDEIWLDCITFLKDILSNPFPHRQTLPGLLEFAAILGAKVDNTNFGEQRKMRRELGDLFLKLLAAIFTTRPISFSDHVSSNSQSEKPTTAVNDKGNGDDLVSILAKVIPDLPKVLLEHDRVLQAASNISVNVISPTVRSKMYPATVSTSTMKLLRELSRMQGNQKTWKKDVGEAFNDGRFFAMDFSLVKDGWLPLLKQWTLADKEKVPELVSRINAPTTAGIVFGVGATSARLEADRKTQLNLRRMAFLILASADDNFVADLPVIFNKYTELLGATPTSSPSSTTRADLFLLTRALVLKTSPIHLSLLWPVVNAEIQAALSSVVAPDNSAASELYTNAGVLQACKLLDLLICVAPDDFQLHEWLFITDTIDAVYRSSATQHVALVDDLSEELGNASMSAAPHLDPDGNLSSASGNRRRPLLSMEGTADDGALGRRDELVAKVLRPFLAQLSIFAFESVYALGTLDREACLEGLLKDIFDERSIARAL